MPKSKLSTATVDWAVELLRRVAAPTENTAISPVAIAISMATAYAGAHQLTAQQISQLFFKGRTFKSTVSFTNRQHRFGGKRE